MRRLLLVLMVATLMALPAQAGPPGLPSNYYGTVRLNGANAPAGSYVLALVQGNECQRDAVDQDAQYGSVYSLNVSADDPATPQVDGGSRQDVVTFVLELPGGGQCPMPQTAGWEGGSSTAVHLAFVQPTAAVVLPMIWR